MKAWLSDSEIYSQYISKTASSTSFCLFFTVVVELSSDLQVYFFFPIVKARRNFSPYTLVRTPIILCQLSRPWLREILLAGCWLVAAEECQALALSVNVVPVTLPSLFFTEVLARFHVFWVFGDSLILTYSIYNCSRLYSVAFTRRLAHFHPPLGGVLRFWRGRRVTVRGRHIDKRLGSSLGTCSFFFIYLTLLLAAIERISLSSALCSIQII